MFENFRGRDTGSVRLVGTAHVSPESRRRVIAAIRADRPDHVAIELDADRFTRLWDGERLGARGLVRSGLSPTAMALGLAFSVKQREIFETMGIAPGEADMLPAARTGREVGSTVSLIDSSNEETLNELAARTVSLAGVRSFVARVTESESRAELCAAADALKAFDDEYGVTGASVRERVELLETMPLDEVERLTDIIGALFPAVADTMLTERNQRMAGRLHWLRKTGAETVAVVGRAHVPGMQALLDDPDEIPEEHVREPRTVRFVTA